MKTALSLTTTLVTITSVSSACTIPSDERWGENSIQYRTEPIADNSGGLTYLGWLPEYQECETSGSSGSRVGLPDGSTGWVTMYNYNYAWNVEVGMRTFWEKSAQGFNSKPSWYKTCPHGYERDSWWKGKCVIPSSTKFLGETCSDKDQCHNDFTKKYVDTTW